ncbi:MAG: hypothetical protein H6875_00150 [Hyphomicrobiaceae bacterium]|nr:hypothetical protein [Hyphomicrobiaceae bacterium]
MAPLFSALIDPYFSGAKQAEKRLNAVSVGAKVASERRAANEQASARRKAVADTLKDIRSRQKTRKLTCAFVCSALARHVTMKTFWISSVITGIVCAAVSLSSPCQARPGSRPHPWICRRFRFARAGTSRARTNARQAKFLKEFANAIDVIVRGIKSGLPLNECLGIIARESPGSHFYRDCGSRRAAKSWRADE